MTALIRRMPGGRCEIGSGGALLDDGHVLQGPLQGGLDARPRRGHHLVCGGLNAAAVAGGLALGRVVSSLQCCNCMRFPPPTGDGTDPAGASSPVAGRVVRDLIRRRAAGRWPCPQERLQSGPMRSCAVAITWCAGRRFGGLALDRVIEGAFAAVLQL